MYVPISIDVFCAAYAGALGGYQKGRSPHSVITSQYVRVAEAALAFASAFDTAFAVVLPNELQLQEIETLSAEIMTFPNNATTALAPSTYTGLADAMIAMMTEASSVVAANVPTPIPVPTPVALSVLEVPTVKGISGSLYSSIPVSGIAAVVDGYYAKGDGGGGSFFWDPTSSATDDGGAVINPTGHVGNGRWFRIFSKNEASLAYWGLISEFPAQLATPTVLAQAAINDAAIVNAVVWADLQGGCVMALPPGTAWISQTADFGNLKNFKMVGAVPAELGNSSDATIPGSVLRTCSAFASGDTIVSLAGTRTSRLENVTVDGKDETGALRGAIGFYVGTEDGAHIVIGVQFEQCHAVRVLCPAILRGISKTSNLIVTPPSVTTSGLDAVTTYVAIFVEITLNGALGAAEFRVSIDGGRNFVASNQTTAADYVIPTTTYHLHFTPGAYTTDYEYLSQCYGLFVGSQSHQEVQNCSFKGFSCKDVGIAVWHEGSQSVANSFTDSCELNGITRCFVLHSGNVFVDESEMSNDSRSNGCLLILAGALASVFNFYSECFGGTQIDLPSSTARTEPILFNGCRLLFHEGGAPSGRIVNYAQNGPICTVGCTYECSDPGGGDVGEVLWSSPNANVPVIDEHGATYLGGVTKTVTGVCYRGTAEGVVAEGGFSDRILKNFGAISFGPMIYTDDPGQAANLPLSGLYGDGAGTRIFGTGNNRLKAIGWRDNLNDGDAGLIVGAKTLALAHAAYDAQIGAPESGGPGKQAIVIADAINPATIAGARDFYMSTRGISPDGIGAAARCKSWANLVAAGAGIPTAIVNAVTGVTQPLILGADALFGFKPSLQFKLADSTLLRSAAVAGVAVPYTIMMVMVLDDTSTVMMTGGPTGGTAQWGVNTTGGHTQELWAYSGTAVVKGDAASPLTTPFLWEATLGVNGEVRYNGTLLGGPVDTGAQTLDGLTLGVGPTGTTAFLTGRIVAAWAGSNVSNGDKAKLRSFFNAAFNLGF